MTTRWWPETEHDLERAAADGQLVESHSLDLKREIEPGDKGNRTLAVDLASLAVDGGILVIGVDEGPPATPTPVRLDGLKERIDQVARSRIDAPLAVTTLEIPTTDDPALGYIVVVVPASSSAPHMVENRYLGRGDTTNIRLNDAEVRRLHALRAADMRRIEDLLDAAIARDPIPPDKRENAHIFVLARPTYGSATLLEDAVDDMSSWLLGLWKLPDFADKFTLTLRPAREIQRRANGWALTNLGPGRAMPEDGDEGRRLDIEVGEDGTIMLFSGHGSERMPDRPSHFRYVFPEAHSGLAWRVVQIAQLVAFRTRYVGNWDFGYAATGMRGVFWYRPPGYGGADLEPYTEDVYRATTSATNAELSGDRAAIVRRLTGRLSRGLTRGTYRELAEAT